MTPLRLAIVLSLYSAVALADADVEFNRDIRPILSDKCFTCHGPDAANRKTKLRFDIESGARVVLKNGVFAIVPGSPEKSELIRRITAGNTALRMPPAYAGREKLTDREIDLMRRWIAQGAHWQPFWSFIPPRRPALPEVRREDWPRNPIDRFILSRLEREGLSPSPEADKTTLIRRLTLDLTGLPPSLHEVDAFLADTSPEAYEKLVDRLLESTGYGEHMAFRWMEVARYGDTNGYQTDGPRDMWRWRDWVINAFNRNMRYDEFTLDQIAGDLLPDATLDQRIATGFNRNHRTSGEGGIIPEEYRVEYVADRAQTTSIVWMGLTLGCARCHDHKYDPISQKDFYRLFAYFNRIPDEQGFVWNYGNEHPYVKAPLPEQQRKLNEFDSKIADLERQYQSLQPELQKAQRKWERVQAHSNAADWTVHRGLVFQSGKAPLQGAGCDAAAADCEISTGEGPLGEARAFDGKRYLEAPGRQADFEYLEPFTYVAWIKPESPNGAILSRSDDYFEGSGHGLYLLDGKIRMHIIHRWSDLGIRIETAAPIRLHEWQHVMVTYDGKRKASGIRIYLNGQPCAARILFDQNNEPLHVAAKTPIRVGAAGGLRFQGMIADARIYKVALSTEEAAALAVMESIAEIAALPEKQRTSAQSGKLALSFLDQATPQEVQDIRNRLGTLRAGRDLFYESVPSVMVMADSPHPRDTFVLKRGAYDSPGEKVSAGVPEVLPQPRPDWPNNRLGFARWLVDRSNPLTARVTVNRFWQSYFGFGIVKTVDDFGSQGEWPMHPELLDWLATNFMDTGWNVKALQKTIVISATYRQSSKVSPDLLQKDPDNRLLARGARLRLGPEIIRDQALAVSGLLVEKVGGPSVKPYQPPGLWQELAGGKGYVQDDGEGLYRRSLYTYWKRTVAPPFMINFDSPNREQCTVFENRTNSPLQALDLMNDVTFLEASRKLAERMIVEGGSSPEQRIHYGYRLVFARVPKPEQDAVLLKTLLNFERNYRADGRAAKEYLAQGKSAVRPGTEVAELAAYTAIASLMLNLDEAITKE
jgi:hypothetical protein